MKLEYFKFFESFYSYLDNKTITTKFRLKNFKND